MVPDKKQLVKDLAHLNRLEHEYHCLECSLDSKYQEIRQWKKLITINYPNLKGDF